MSSHEVTVYVAESADQSEGTVCESYDEARTIASDEGGRVLARVFAYDRTEIVDDFTRSSR